MTRPRSWRARLPGWLALLVVAAAVNVVVAWACALWSGPRNWRLTSTLTLSVAQPPSDFSSWYARLDALPKGWIVESTPTVPRGSPPACSIAIDKSSAFGVMHTQLMRMDREYLPRARMFVGGRSLIIDCGWPATCLTAAHHHFSPLQVTSNTIPDAAYWSNALDAPEWLGGVPVSPSLGAGLWFPLPYGVRPLGFTLNTLFWLGVITLPAFAFRRTRSALRRRRGLCIHCAYDLRDLPTCPECGAIREKMQCAAVISV